MTIFSIYAKLFPSGSTYFSWVNYIYVKYTYIKDNCIRNIYIENAFIKYANIKAGYNIDSAKDLEMYL